MMYCIPTPKRIVPRAQRLPLTDLSGITLPAGADARLVSAALTLAEEIAAVTGRAMPVLAGEALPDGIHIAAKGGSGEGYTLAVEPDGITLTGEGPAGAFYGVQTLRQLVATAQENTLSCGEVTDAPDFAHRGFYHDVTRGRVPTLATLKRLCDTLSYYKINQLQLYLEDAFAFRELEGVMTVDQVLTPSEIRELDDYCHAHFVELVPSVATFGHLYRLLQSPRYAYLCEYPQYTPTRHDWIEKMMHHTLDVFHPDAIRLVQSMIDQVIGLCRSDRFNICCDETFDLCKGKNAGKDAGEAYFGFVSQIIRHVKARGKQVMMWGDIVLRHPEKLSLLPADTIMLHWDYRAAPDEAGVKAFEQAGFPLYVCPGTQTWNRFVEDAPTASANISALAAYGSAHGAKGLLNTNWGDFGNVCGLNGALYGLTLGAQKGWHTAAPADAAYETAFSVLAYGQRDENMAELIRRLSVCENAAPWGTLIAWISDTRVEGKPAPIPADATACRTAVAECERVIERLRALPPTPAVSDLILSARAIRLMNRIFLYQGGWEAAPDPAAFLRDYRAAWLRDDKPSDLHRIEATLRQMCE